MHIFWYNNILLLGVHLCRNSYEALLSSCMTYLLRVLDKFPYLFFFQYITNAMITMSNTSNIRIGINTNINRFLESFPSSKFVGGFTIGIFILAKTKMYKNYIITQDDSHLQWIFTLFWYLTDTRKKAMFGIGWCKHAYYKCLYDYTEKSYFYYNNIIILECF